MLRKIIATGIFTAGAALAFAPLASADTTDVLGSTDTIETTTLNDFFNAETQLLGLTGDVTAPSATDPFATVTGTDVSTVQGSGNTLFDLFTYGAAGSSSTGLDSTPGAGDLFNGALVQFDDAWNAGSYGWLDNGALIPATDLLGPSSDITTALATGTDMGAAGDFLQNGVTDLTGFFGAGDLASLFPDLTSLIP
jgi:hypothetical protein